MLIHSDAAEPAKTIDLKEAASRFREAELAVQNANRSMEFAKTAALKANTDLWVADKLIEAFSADYPQYDPNGLEGNKGEPLAG